MDKTIFDNLRFVEKKDNRMIGKHKESLKKISEGLVKGLRHYLYIRI